MAHGAGHVPAGVVVPGSGGERDAGLHLEASDEGLDGEFSGDRVDLTGRGDGRPQRSAAMNGGPVGVEGVVEVQDVCRDPIRQRRVAGRGALPGADDGGRARAVAWVESTDPRADPDALGRGGARNSAAEPVDEAAHRLVHHVRGKVLDPHARPRTWPTRRLTE